MNQQPSAYDILRTLKSILKAHKITYSHLATRVSFSESTIKNLFHQKNISIERLIEICEVIDIPIQELIQMASRQKESEFILDPDQEEFFADNPAYYYFFREYFFQKLSLQEIQDKYQLSEISVYKYLRALEKIGLLELKPGNKTKFKVHGKQNWKLFGPWMKKFFSPFMSSITDKVLKGEKDPNTYTSNISFFTLTEGTLKKFLIEIDELTQKYREIAYQDYIINKHEKGIPLTWTCNVVPCDIYDEMSHIPNQE